MFQFKHFSCRHEKSSMKIGVDGVLIGSWAEVDGSEILDVGTGCGIIALMCAQRNPKAKILAVDIHPESIDEASLNFNNSPWSSRLKARLEDFMDIKHKHFDLIISNPPYFNSGISTPDSPRLVARHQSSLSPFSLLSHGRTLLREGGRIAMVVPAAQVEDIGTFALSLDLHLGRICLVKGHPSSPVKRALIEFSDQKNFETVCSQLILESSPGHPTVDYISLCHDFYLKM